MRAIPHMLVGAGAGLAIAHAAGLEPLHVGAIAALAALLPDLDHPHSTASRKLSEIVHLAQVAGGLLVAPQVLHRTHHAELAIVAGVAVWFALGLLGRALAPYRFVAHRGPLHAAIAAGVLPLALLLAGVGPEWTVAVTLGWVSHLIADAPSPHGLPLLWPLRARPLHVTPSWFRPPSGLALFEIPVGLGALLVGIWTAGLPALRAF